MSICVLGASPGLPFAKADEGSDWTALIALRKQIGDETFKNKPQEAVAQLQEFYTGRKLHPILAAEVVLQVAEITRTQLKQPDEAMKMLDAAWQGAKANSNPAQPVEVMYLEGLAGALLSQKKAADTQRLLQENFKTIEAAATCGHPHLEVFASRCLEHLSDAQNALRPADAKPDDTIALLENAFREMPVFLNPERQKASNWQEGWMYERLVAALSEAGREADALSWGKLFFAEAAFDQASIQRATKALGGVWARGNDLAKVRAFAVAQAGGEGAAPSPLAGVAFPKFEADGAVAARLKSLRGLQAQGTWRGRVAPIITLEIALGQWRSAMENAQGLLLEDASAPDGPQQVARVFKAKDGSVARANGFLAYLQNKAPNPVPAFLQEADALTTNGGEAQ
ncbi:hypothetical protein [Abditibacterium utsteinense]|uniref:hypothetical protein n=1 Tax=Abditibacterium utsteinense TaxID=1960156 RepID=UPI001300378A|nr:hypothetical protein [Abditibacterium utsteinense]